MTDTVNPSLLRPAGSYETAGTIQLNDPNQDGYISPPNQPSIIAQEFSTIDHTQLNAFEQTSSPTSLDVTFDGGEGFLFGAWFARDVQTTVTLGANESNQIIYVGWDKDNRDTVIIGEDSEFDTYDPKLELYSFDTDANGVIN